MTVQLMKGQNGPLTATDVVLSVVVGAPADLSALLVTDAQKVRSDADFVFYNQPQGPGVSLVNGQIRVSLAQVPADIAAVRAVITLDDSSAHFGQFAPPKAVVADAAGAPLFEYVIDGLSSESIVIAVELYRRGADWKVRAVGQGYAGGFAALVTDHGVSVDDSPAEPTPVPPTAPPVPAAPVEVNLSKDRPVSLQKNQKVTLRKEGGVALTQIHMGLGWDPVVTGKLVKRSANIDLDASAVMFVGNQLGDVAYYGQLTSKDGSIRHQGDNLTGEGEGDDEVIVVDLTRVPANVTAIVFIVTSYKGHTFAQVQNAFCRLVDVTTGAELARYTLSGGSPNTAMVMAKVFRVGNDWKLQAIGAGINAKHPGEAAPQLPPFADPGFGG